MFNVRCLLFFKDTFHHGRRIDTASHELSEVLDLVLKHHLLPKVLQILQRLPLEGELLENGVVSAEKLMVECSYHTDSLDGTRTKHFSDKLNEELQVVVPLIVFQFYISILDRLNQARIQFAVKGRLSED